MTTKLELVNHGYLDIITDIPLALNFNLNDVRDIANRGGVWSKTVKIPGTSNNNQILGNIFNTNINTLTFNPVVKEPCRIIVDGVSTFEGIFQVRKINKNFDNSQDFKVIYDCYIKSDTSSFYESISGKYLDEIDLSEFNHVWDISTVDNSMLGGTWTDGYQYYLSWNSNNDVDYQEQDLIPAIYAKIYWDRIFESAGYDYQWDELFPLNFDKLIIPYNGETVRGEVDQQYKFAAGISTTYEYKMMASIGLNNISFAYYGSNEFSYLLGPGRAQMIFEDDTTSPWQDVNSLYDTTTGRYYVENYNGNIEFNTKYTLSLQLQMFSNTGGGPSNDIISNEGTANVYFTHMVKVYDINGNQLGVLSTQDTDVVSFDGNNMSTVYSTDYKVEATTLDMDMNAIYDSSQYPNAAYIGNEVKIYGVTDSDDPWGGFQDPNTNKKYRGDFYAVFYPQSDETGHFNNSPETAIVSGSPININNVIPKKIKQSDFVLGIIEMFNLYIKEDPYDPTTLIIKTRDKFYDDGIELDWTSKVDIESIDVEILSNTQQKRKRFSYKDDNKDDLATLYKEQTKETFGQLEYIFENEFIKGVDTVGPIFSPTIITNGYKRGSNLIIPYIDSRSPKNNIRILFSGDVLNGNWTYNRDGLNFYKTQYRYAGHLWPNPKNPTQDLNFGICDYYSHAYQTMTDNNLYNRFYSTQMDIFDTGHIMTAYFNLSYKDILNLKLDERIYVYDSWWHINEIKDFDINNDGLTKVELITADPNVDIFTANNDTFVKNSKPSDVNNVINSSSIRKNNNLLGTGVSGLLIGGSKNTIQPGSSNGMILGSNNKYKGDNNIVNGNNNKVLGDNVIILGKDGYTIEQDDVTITNTLIRSSDIVSGGRDEILNHFPENKVINIINGGRDEIRPLGGFSIESIIGGGRDSII